MTNISISFFQTQQFNAIAFIVLGFIIMFIGTMIPNTFEVDPQYADVIIWFLMILSVTCFILALVCVHKSYEDDKKNATTTRM